METKTEARVQVQAVLMTCVINADALSEYGIISLRLLNGSQGKPTDTT